MWYMTVCLQSKHIMVEWKNSINVHIIDEICRKGKTRIDQGSDYSLKRILGNYVQMYTSMSFRGKLG